MIQRVISGMQPSSPSWVLRHSQAGTSNRWFESTESKHSQLLGLLFPGNRSHLTNQCYIKSPYHQLIRITKRFPQAQDRITTCNARDEASSHPSTRAGDARRAWQMAASCTQGWHGPEAAPATWTRPRPKQSRDPPASLDYERVTLPLRPSGA